MRSEIKKNTINSHLIFVQYFEKINYLFRNEKNYLLWKMLLIAHFMQLSVSSDVLKQMCYLLKSNKTRCPLISLSSSKFFVTNLSKWTNFGLNHYFIIIFYKYNLFIPSKDHFFLKVIFPRFWSNSISCPLKFISHCILIYSVRKGSL